MNIRDIRKYFSVFAIVVMFQMIIGCEYTSDIFYPEPPIIEESDKEINIGLVLPLTGRLEQSFGRHIENALELAKDEINITLFADTHLNFI